MIKFDRFQGDPALFLTEQGAKLIFNGGQSVMDAGLENAVKISLFTRPGWVGNTLFKNKDKKIGSEFEEENEKSITLQSLRKREQAAISSLQWMIDSGLISSVDVYVSNQTSNILEYDITIRGPGNDIQKLLFTKNGSNWLAQIFDPATGRV